MMEQAHIQKTESHVRQFRKLILWVFAVTTLVAIAAMLEKPAHATTTFTVDSTLDYDDPNPSNNICDANVSNVPVCTLRAAIEQANDTPGADTIEFDIPGPGVHTIHVNSSGYGRLPTITEQVSINGYSQHGASVNTLARGTNAKPLIQLDGSKLSGSETGLYIAAPDVAVGGLVINSFSYGIQILDAASDSRIAGNFIGTDPSGTMASGNDYNGVVIFDHSSPTNNTVGGSTLAARNLISGNSRGIVINSDGNRVTNNLIGTQRDGKSPLGNDLDGLYIFSTDFASSSNNIVGGSDLANANTIAFNGRAGVGVNMGGSTARPNLGNTILSNYIFSNDELGINLGGSGVTPNDAGDADTGPNNLQNYPAISSAMRNAAGETTIEGSLNSLPGTIFEIQFFSNPKGANEGKKLLGYKFVTTDGSGNTSFTFTTSKAKLGQNITATATRTLNYTLKDTSEFSAPRTVVAS